jgi:capsular exopolysaccharide synthesis family protein
MLEHYQSILTKQWQLIIICVVVIGLGTYVASRLMTPIYQSTVLIQVTIHTTTNPADYNNLLASDQLVQTEAQLATSNPVLSQVATHYSGLTVDQLATETEVTPKVNTQLFEISVQDASPTRAASLANDIAAALISQQAQETQQDTSDSQQQLQQELSNARHNINTTTSKIASLQGRLANLEAQRGSQTQIVDLQTQINGLQNQLYQSQDLYSQWQTTLAQLELTEAQSGNFLRIAQPALPASSPVRPEVLFNTLIGLIAGLFIGLTLAILFDQLDVRVRTPQALSQVLGWPLIATVWFVGNAKGEQEAIVNPKERSVNIESYRILRTNIGLSAVDKQMRSLIVTSALPHEGKSTIAANLAIFMAKTGKKILLIDADLRHPSLHQKFNFPADKKGLSNAIVAFSQLQSNSSNSSDISLSPYIHTVDIPNLQVMPAGTLPPNPPELLDSKAMNHLVNAITSNSEIEMVIFDTPPLLGLSDTSILLPKVDSTLVVVDITRSTRKNLTQVKSILTQAGTHILGCVVNKQVYNRSSMPYAPYYYYYGAREVADEEEQSSEHEQTAVLSVASSSARSTQSRKHRAR